MSQYFSFYIGKKNEDGTIECVAPFKIVDGQPQLYPIGCWSRSFIDSQVFLDIAQPIEIDKMGPVLKSTATNEGFFNSNLYSTGYMISIMDMQFIAEKYHRGIFRGYINTEDYDYLVQNNFTTAWDSDVELVSADRIAVSAIVGNSEYKNYLPVMLRASCDPGYQADLLLESFYNFNYTEDSYCFIFETEY